MQNSPRTFGVVFDLDGTLVDSPLDFEAMRRDLGLAKGVPILESLATIADPEQRRLQYEIVLTHEERAARESQIMPGAYDVLQWLADKRIRSAIFTRNARRCAEATVRKLKIEVATLVAREDAPPKPDPAGLLKIVQEWNCAPDQVLFIGDYLYDLEAGARAGVPTLLYTPTPPDFSHQHPNIITHLAEIRNFIRG